MTQSKSCSPALRNNRTARNRNQFFQHVPRVNIWKGDDGMHLEMAIPGINKADVGINIESGRLTINHNACEPSDIKYLKKGFDLNGFSRSFSLSKDIDADKVEAQFNEGILRLMLPVKEAAKPKTISIQ